MRSLKLDSFRVARIGLFLAILNMTALIVWFFFARVTLYETSSTINITPEGHIIASFPPEIRARINPGQPAVLRLQTGSEGPPLVIPTVVYSTDLAEDQVELLIIAPEFSAADLPESISGRIEVEAEYVTPAQLVLRASGKYLNQGRLPVSPQDQQETEP
jgi:hypothetical protein